MVNASALKTMLNNIHRPILLGMIHVPALPGTPLSMMTIPGITETVIKEAEKYAKTEIDGLIVENMHDLPYVQAHELQPETTAMMTKICINVTQAIGVNRRRKMALGVQVLAGGNRQALAVAQAADFDFIRAESFVYSHIADEGQMNACAGQLLRYRKAIGADKIAILTDIKKKHCSHSLTADLTVGDFAEAAEFFQADGVILTGTATGRAANPREISEVRSQSRLPIFIGSGITNENLLQFAKADGYIVGSHFKTGGRWQNQLDIDRIHRLVEAVKKMSPVRKSIP